MREEVAGKLAYARRALKRVDLAIADAATYGGSWNGPLAIHLRRLDAATTIFLREYAGAVSLPWVGSDLALTKLARRGRIDAELLAEARRWLTGNGDQLSEQALDASADPVADARAMRSVAERVIEATLDAWPEPAGELREGLDLLSSEGVPGALVRIQIEAETRAALRASGALLEIEEPSAMGRAWNVAAHRLRFEFGWRTAWTTLEVVARGSRDELVAAGRETLANLRDRRFLPARAPLEWHVLFFEHRGGDAATTLTCDPGYDVRTVAGRSALVWIVPKAGTYPDVEIVDP